MTISTTPVQSTNVYKALRLNSSITALNQGRQTSFGRDLVSFSPVSIAVNQAFNHAGFDPGGKPFTSLDLLRGRSGANLEKLNTFLSGATFVSTYDALGGSAQADVKSLIASILADSSSESTTYDRLGRIQTILQESPPTSSQ